jgi:hypothetical protein
MDKIIVGIRLSIRLQGAPKLSKEWRDSHFVLRRGTKKIAKIRTLKRTEH